MRGTPEEHAQGPGGQDQRAGRAGRPRQPEHPPAGPATPRASGSVPGVRPTPRARLTAWVDGWVQGVGFRWWVRRRALELGLTGSVQNLPDGRVEITAEGPPPVLEELLALLAGPGAPGQVSKVTVSWSKPGESGPASFVAF